MNYLTTVFESIYGDEPLYKKILLTIGMLWGFRFAYKFIRGLNYFFGKWGSNISKRYGVGSWVVITGCTDGIGKEFAYQLAKQHFNIFLISRTESKLQAVAEDLETKFKIKTQYCVADFGRCHEDGFYDEIVQKTQDLDVSILINNVGIDSIERYDELSEDYIKKTILVNSWSMAMLTRKFAGRLGERYGRSACITLSSMIGLYPGHHYNIYSASKAFSDMLSLCLSREYKTVDFMSLCPSEVSTAMTSNKPEDIFTIKVDKWVSWALNDLKKGYVRTEGHWKHKGQSFLIRETGSLFNFLWENFILADMRKERNLPPPRLYEKKRQA